MYWIGHNGGFNLYFGRLSEFRLKKNDTISFMSWWNNYASFVTASGAIAVAVTWYINIKMKDVKRDICDIKEKVDSVAAETKTNGGSSIKDQVGRLEDRTNEADILRREMNEKIDKMYIILIDYIAGQNSKKRSKSKSDI